MNLRDVRLADPTYPTSHLKDEYTVNSAYKRTYRK